MMTASLTDTDLEAEFAELRMRYAAEPTRELARTLLHHRQLIGRQILSEVADRDFPAFPPRRTASRPGRLHEIDARDLDGEAIREGVLGTGALVVRGLYDADTVEMLAERARAPVDEDPSGEPVHFAQAKADEVILLMDAYERTALFAALEAFYGDGPVVMSNRRAKLRRTVTNSPLKWHQDMAFFGQQHHAINCWAAITPCGGPTPTLKFLPRRLEEVIGWDPANGRAKISYSKQIGPFLDPLFAETPPQTVDLNPGDAVLFDDATLHATAPGAEESFEQIVTISWFFHAASYPDRVDAPPLIIDSRTPVPASR